MKRKPTPTEHQIQSAFIQWVRLQHPDVIVMAIPNDGLRSPVTGRRYKQRGMLPGTPDVFVACPHGKYGGLWIEFKRAGGRVTPAQQEVMERLRASGYAAHVATSVEQAMNVVAAYLENV